MTYCSWPDGDRCLLRDPGPQTHPLRLGVVNRMSCLVSMATIAAGVLKWLCDRAGGGWEGGGRGTGDGGGVTEFTQKKKGRPQHPFCIPHLTFDGARETTWTGLIFFCFFTREFVITPACKICKSAVSKWISQNSLMNCHSSIIEWIRKYSDKFAFTDLRYVGIFSL